VPTSGSARPPEAAGPLGASSQTRPDRRPAKRADAVKLRLPRIRLTGRNMMITAMVLFLVVVLASPLQTYLNRRDSLSAAQQQQQQLNAEVAQLQTQSAQWNDPAYIERQARIRLQYVRPGDTLYTVLGADGRPRSGANLATDVGVTRTGHHPSWNSTLWSSVKDADADVAHAP
jgi:cell division protein FtsB